MNPIKESELGGAKILLVSITAQKITIIPEDNGYLGDV